MKRPISPKELEKRLNTAYSAGFNDGYDEGLEDAHTAWHHNLMGVRGIGPKRFAAILQHITAAVANTAESKGMGKSELSKEVDEFVNELRSVVEADGRAQGHRRESGTSFQDARQSNTEG